ncbi:hypothetical protein FQA39_LY08809 [Lamprigera yunnana]|nr:hypothetical protein FQA39_LY08809 [Lamprigera yunnana]
MKSMEKAVHGVVSRETGYKKAAQSHSVLQSTLERYMAKYRAHPDSTVFLKTLETCTTPNKEQAQCISLYTCPILLNALITQKKEAIDFVRQSHCGTWSNDIQPLVCCGSKSVLTQTKVSQPTSSSNPIREVLSDRRFCGYQHTDDYLYTENVTAIDEFPWLAVLKYQRDSDLDDDLEDDFYEFGCSASLIHLRYVLTAAQCLRFHTSKVVAVRLGEYNIKREKDCVKFSTVDECSNPVQDVGIERRIKHPKYNRRFGLHDIALLRLNRSIVYTDYIRPICLPFPGTKFAQIGNKMLTTGFGRTGTNKDNTTIKKKIPAVLVSNSVCAKQYSDFLNSNRNVTDNIMCATDTTTERSCEGDSGAPLMFSHRTQWHIEGVAVWSVAVCELYYPSAYTKVVNYLDWIEANVDL